MKIAIMGGSFNPLHNGHAMLAETVAKDLGYDKILFIPTNIPPHKVIDEEITPEQRLEMLKSFCKQSNGLFEVEDCEIKRGGISYTSDTVKFILEKYKNELSGKIGLIMGEEIAAEFHKWYNVEFLAENCHLIISPRIKDYDEDENVSKNKPSGNFHGDFSTKFDKNNFPYDFTLLSSPMLPISSTQIRERVKNGRSFRYLVPQSIFEYIDEYELYRKN